MAVIYEVSNHYEWWEIALAFTTALATLGAAAVALYVGVFREWRGRPRISLEFDSADPGDCQVVGVETELGRTSAGYARLRVENRSKRQTAENVEVFVWNASSTRSRAHGESIISDLPLLVSNSNPPTSRVDVAPEAARHIDFAYLVRGQSNWAVSVHPRPRDRRDVMLDDTVDFELILTARNARSSRYTVTVTWDDIFEESTMFEHLEVTKLRRK